MIERPLLNFNKNMFRDNKIDDNPDKHEFIHMFLNLGPLKDAVNLICTPRTAWFSESSTQELREAAAHEVRRGLTGKMPGSLRNCVNREYLNAARKFI